MFPLSVGRSTLALLVLVLAGCAPSVADETGTSEGAATAVPLQFAGNYDGHMRGWNGSLAIRNASSEKVDFEFEISPDLDIAPIGRLGGTATLVDGRYRYDDGSCTLDLEHVSDGPGAQRGDLFVTASIACGLMLGIDGHSTSSTAFDLTSTWRRW